VAAFTTAHARVELYKQLDLVGAERLVYCDTDSLVFSYRPGDVMPQTGDFVGDLTDEVLKNYGPHAYIDTFVALGPKMYAYSLTDERSGKVIKVERRAKGVVLNSEVSERLTFETFERMARVHYEWFKDGGEDSQEQSQQQQRCEPIIQELSFPRFRINKKDRSIDWRIMDKKIKIIFTKRKMLICKNAEQEDEEQYSDFPYSITSIPIGYVE